MYLLTVIIPVYNSSAWLHECMESILYALPNNTYDVQIILVDDGSVDCSNIICDEYAASYSFIKVLHKANGGVASARNAGLGLARGRYIAWIDPDDRISPSWFTEIQSVLLESKPDLLVFDMLRFSEKSSRSEIYGRNSGWIPRDQFVRDIYRDIRILSGLPNKVIRADLFSSVHFDPALPILEDFQAMPRILEQVQTVYYLPECLYHYRQHSGSLLHHVTPERAYQSFEIAKQRAQEAPAEYRSAAETAASVQAHAFCRNCRCFPAYSTKKQQIRSCRQYVQTRLPALSVDPDIPIMWKLKFLLTAIGIL